MTTTDTVPAAAPLISICIPTYNRGAFLPDLFDSIVREWDALTDAARKLGIEVVVSDNGSSDDTADRVARYRQRLALTYVRQPQNIGADRNFLAVVAAARGRFCWLMGSDDVIEIGGLAAVLDALARWDVAGLSVNYVRRSFDLAEQSAVRPPVAYTNDVVVEERTNIYRNFVGHWGYLSGHVVRRDLWNKVVASGEPLAFLNSYVHVFIMGRMIERLPRWGYVHRICVGWRGRNDSFVTRDHVDRMMIDVVGYRDVTRHLFRDDPATISAVADTIAGTHILVHYQIAKIFYHSAASLRHAALTLTQEYWRTRAYWRKLLPWMLIPAPVLHHTWVTYQRLRERLDPTFPIHPQARRRTER